MGNINTGYNFLSSLFFLNSTFYLPFIKLYSFHFTIISFLLFFNYFLLVKIFSSKTDKFFKYFYLLTFIFFNLSFNRLAEFGMDKPGQLLIVILIISLFETIIKKSNEKKIDNILLLVPLVGLCISTKTYFLTYLLLGLSIFIIDKNYLKNFNYLIFSNHFYLCFDINFDIFITLSLMFNFSFTNLCFDESLIWARDLNDVKGLSMWVEQCQKQVLVLHM